MFPMMLRDQQRGNHMILRGGNSVLAAEIANWELFPGAETEC